MLWKIYYATFDINKKKMPNPIVSRQKNIMI